MARNLRSGNGINGRNNGSPVEEPPVNMNGAGVNARQVPKGAIPGMDAAAANTAVLQGIQGFQELFGQLLQHLSIWGGGGQASVAAAVPPHGTAGDDPPPPPAIPGQGPPSGISYWDDLRLMKELGTKTFSGDTNSLMVDNWRKVFVRNFESARCPMN